MKGKWKFIKHMLGMGLALLLCLICFSAPVAAQAATSGTSGNLTWEYDEAIKTLTISGEGEMRDYSSASALPWYSFCEDIETVIIEDGVTSIGDNAFSKCSSLTEITIPDGVTRIGYSTFYDCSKLTKIMLPDSVRSIDHYAFYRCSSLTEIRIPDGVTSIGYSTFYGCSKLTEITIPDSVTSIGDFAFGDCKFLTEIRIPDGVTSIGKSVFLSCSSLTELTLPDSVTSIGNSAFYGCSSLTELMLPDGVTSIGKYAFYGCRSLAELTLPDSVTSIDEYVFYGCSSLTEITIPDGVTSIGENAFYYCSSLTEITLPDSVISIGKFTFCGCSSLTEITIPDSVTSIGLYAFNACSKLVTVNLGCNWKANIDSGYFYGATNIENANYSHVGDVRFIANDTEKSITSVCETCDDVLGTVTLFDPDADAKIMYDGTSKTAKYEGEIPGETPVITYTGATATNGEAVKAGTYTATMTVGGQKVSVQFVIEKLEWAPNAPQKTMTVPYTMTKVKDVVLPENWEWQKSYTDRDLIVGEVTEGTAVYRGADLGNYKYEAIIVEITRAACVHEGGVATCVEKATCEVCGEQYGELDTANHVEEEVCNQSEASCTVNGYTGDTCCADCGTVLEQGEAIEAKGHIGGTATCVEKATCEVCGEQYGEVDATNHGEEELRNQTEATCVADGYTGEIYCKDCDAVLVEGEVIAAKGHVGGTATCTEKAICEVCGNEYNGEDAANHGEEVVMNKSDATCVTDGYTGDTCCKDCGAVLVAGEAIAAKGHVGGTATCTEKAICKVCGEQYGELDIANHGEEEVCNQSEASCTVNGYTGDTCCADCGIVLEQGEAIEAKGHVGGTATCTEKATCEVCGEKYNELDTANHGEKEVRNQAEATCTVNGYTGDTCCKDCGTVLVAGEAIVATGHEYKSEVTKAPTTAENGVRTYTCEKCGDTYTEEIEKLSETVTAEVTYATHWGNGGQVEITLTNKGETLLDGWNVELDLNIDAKLSNSWGDGYVTSFENGHVCITNQSWVTSFEAGATKKVYLQYEGTLPNLVTCVKSDDVLVSRINYLNHWGNGGQIEICLENLGDALNGSWGTELDINLIGTMTNTWGDGYVTSYENGHIVIENQSWVTSFEAGATKSVWLQYDGVLPVYASNAVFK